MHKPTSGSIAVGGESRLLDRHLLLGTIVKSKWATRLDIKVAWAVIERYYTKFKNSRVSLSFLENATGSSRTNIIQSLRRLIENGAITVVQKGTGTRPSEYDLNFSQVKPSSDGGVTASSGDAGVTTAVTQESPLEAASSHVGVTQTYLPDMATAMATVCMTDPAVPTAPPVSGCSPPPADAAELKSKTSFDELWIAFNNRFKRADAKAAYKKLSPSPELHEQLVAAANIWATHYEAKATESRYRKYLHSWLAGECWLEEPPIPFERRYPLRQQTGRKVQQARALAPPKGKHEIEIVGFDIIGPNDIGETYFRTRNRILSAKNNNTEFEVTCLHFDNSGTDELGSHNMSELTRATGRDDPEDPSDFVGAKLSVSINANSEVRYRCTSSAN